MLKLFVVLASTCSLVCSIALAQTRTPAGGAISSADVYIDSVKGSITPNNFVCTVSVNNQNDDDSQGTIVIVLLPLQVEKIYSINTKGFSGKCSGARNGPYFGYVTCQLGSLPVNSAAHPQPPKIIEIATSPSTALPGYPQTCGAFVYSSVGDIDKSNNYCYWPRSNLSSCP